MKGEFRFVLDDFIVLSNQPKGWEEASIIIKRNNDFNGLFVEYLTELEFWGDGYNYIKRQIDALGYCFNVKIDIDYTCNSDYQKVFTGYINIPRSQINNETCTLTANLEVNTIYSDFLNSVDRQISLTQAENTFSNGNIVQLDTDVISYHNVETGNNTLNQPTDNRVISIEVIKGLDYLSKMITQGQLPVISDFFSNVEPNREFWTVDLSGAALSSGQTIALTYRNMWGITVTKSKLFAISESVTLAQLGFDICEISDRGADTIPRTTCNYFFHTGFSAAYPFMRSLVCESWLPIEILSVQITGAGTHPTVLVEKVQSYQKGGKGLYFHSQLNETFNGRIWPVQPLSTSRISFRELYTELDALYGLGMQIEGTPGNYKLRIEPLEYFYSQASQLSLLNNINVKTEFDVENDFNKIQLGSSTDAFGVIDFSNAGYMISANVAAGSNSWSLTLGLGVYQPSVGDYFKSAQNLQVFKIETITSTGIPATFTTTENAIFASVDDTLNVGRYVPINVPIATVNDTEDVAILSCATNTLKLQNQFVTEIEKHGDQTRSTYSGGTRHISASDKRDKFAFIHVDQATMQSRQYQYIVTDPPTVPTIRYAFNGTLTNHHKILNNDIRIKYAVSTFMPEFTPFSGQEIIYKNNSIIKPLINHTINTFISYTDINSVIANPAQSVYADIDRNTTAVKCWIKQATFNINTKECEFILYESI